VKTKREILQELEEARADLLASIEGLSPDDMRRPGAVGIWSVKDALAHLAAWEAELVTALNEVENKQVPGIIDIEDIDEWNEDRYRENVRRSLDVILDDLAGVHTMLLRMLGDMDEKTLTDNRQFRWMEGEPLLFLVEENATLHEQEHAGDIRRWREEQGL
jgi:uncharacterized damage-inducible protein DinB